MAVENSITENPNPEPVATQKGKSVVCGFCDCTVAPDGGVIRTSERQQKLLKLEQSLADAREEVDKLKRDLAARPAVPVSEGIPPNEAPKKKFGIR